MAKVSQVHIGKRNDLVTNIGIDPLERINEIAKYYLIMNADVEFDVLGFGTKRDVREFIRLMRDEGTIQRQTEIVWHS